MSATSTSTASVQALDFESICPLIRCGCLLCGSCSSNQRFACGFLQIPPRGGHPCRPASTSPCRVCIGLQPTSQCALPGAQRREPGPEPLLTRLPTNGQIANSAPDFDHRIERAVPVERLFVGIWVGHHCPSTTNLYSYRPGGRARLVAQCPLHVRFMGVASGDHALKPPQTETRCAWGSSNANVTSTVCAALGDEAAASWADGCADAALRDRAREVSGVGSTGLATVSAEASGLADLVFFCVLG